jgi:hypothetical protein
MAVGYFQNFSKNEFETSVELYYKKLSNLIEYKNGVNITMNNMLETGLMNAKGTNYGIELLLKKNTGKVDGWISYTYSRAFKQTTSNYPEEQINDNQVYPSSFDRPNNIIVMGTYHYNKRLRLTFSYNYATGRPVTLPEEVFTLDGQAYVQYSNRNKYRLPDYNRLDFSLSLDETIYHKRKWKGSWNLSVINVLSNQNIYSVIYNTSGLYKFLIIDQPLPTLTYNFLF